MAGNTQECYSRNDPTLGSAWSRGRFRRPIVVSLMAASTGREDPEGSRSPEEVCGAGCRTAVVPAGFHERAPWLLGGHRLPSPGVGRYRGGSTGGGHPPPVGSTPRRELRPQAPAQRSRRGRVVIPGAKHRADPGGGLRQMPQTRHDRWHAGLATRWSAAGDEPNSARPGVIDQEPLAVISENEGPAPIDR